MTQGCAERLALRRVPDLGTLLPPRGPRPGGQDPLSVDGAGETPNRPVVPAAGVVRNRFADHLSGSEIQEPDRAGRGRREGRGGVPCLNIACLPSKHIIHGAKAASFSRRTEEFGISQVGWCVNMAAVHDRMRRMSDRLTEIHLDKLQATYAEIYDRAGARAIQVLSGHRLQWRSTCWQQQMAINKLRQHGVLER